ncbi:MAG: PIG-L family deacetylase [Phycisphaeraceae bacterium]|nr:PIG-L family deacetylase [Phycisphaeraceae bacterium]
MANSSPGAPLTVLAVVAHPDDVEFMMAGTLLRLRDRGAAVHLWNLATGSCGTATLDREAIVRMRWAEAQAAARELGATAHEPLADDLAIFYEPELLAKVAAVVRQVGPDIILTQSPADYMEDHQNTTRLVVTAAFARGMRNFVTDPPTPVIQKPVTLYHAMPHGLRDGLRRLVRCGLYVDIGPVLERKKRMLAQHRSQKQWLDVSQGMDAYLAEMERMGRQVGRMSGKFELAEGFRRHSHLGFCEENADPLAEALGEACVIDRAYERELDG